MPYIPLQSLEHRLCKHPENSNSLHSTEILELNSITLQCAQKQTVAKENDKGEILTLGSTFTEKKL